MRELTRLRGLQLIRLAGVLLLGVLLSLLALVLWVPASSAIQPSLAAELPLLVLWCLLAGLLHVVWRLFSPSLFRIGHLLWATARLTLAIAAIAVLLGIVGAHVVWSLRPDRQAWIVPLAAGLAVAALATAGLIAVAELLRREYRAHRDAVLARWAWAQATYPADQLTRLAAFVRQETDPRETPALTIRGAAFPGLTSKPWFDPAEIPGVDGLVAAFPVIRREAEALLGDAASSIPYPSYYGLSAKGWYTSILYKNGERHDARCLACPEADRVVRSTPGWTQREVTFSVMQPHGHIPDHRDEGNLFVTLHLGLVVPDGCAMTVAGITRRWVEGECLIFDSSYEHSCVNPSDRARVVMLIDAWHPGLTAVEREFLQALFPEAAAGAGRDARGPISDRAPPDARGAPTTGR